MRDPPEQTKKDKKKITRTMACSHAPPSFTMDGTTSAVGTLRASNTSRTQGNTIIFQGGEENSGVSKLDVQMHLLTS